MGRQCDQIGRISQIDTLMSSLESLTSGGQGFLDWVKNLVSMCVGDTDTLASGGMIVPQMGKRGGTPQEFSVKECPNSACVSQKIIWETVNSSQRESNSAFTQVPLNCSHNQRHLDLVLMPIMLQPGFEAGLLWVVAERSVIADSKIAMRYASAFLSLAIVSQKASIALEQLSSSWWFGRSRKKEIAANIAKTCLKALSCASVIVWELPENSQKLKTLVSAGNAGADLSVDIDVGQGAAGACVTQCKTITINDLQDSEELRRQGIDGVGHPAIVKALGWRSAVFVPLDVGGRVAGVMSVYGQRPSGFFQMEKNIASAFAQRFAAGLAVNHAEQALSEIMRKLEAEAPAIEAGILAMERVHDAVNQLAFAENNISVITRRYRRDPQNSVNKSALAAAANIDEANKIIKALANRTRIKKVALSPRKIKQILEETIKRVELEAEGSGIRIALDCPDDLVVKVDKELMERVFLNLLDNAVYWLDTDTKGRGRQVQVSVKPESGHVVVRFWDNGPGISPSDLSHVFDYFFTTRAERGMGFGLPIAKRIIDLHDGSLFVKSRWGYETEFTIVLPLDSG